MRLAAASVVLFLCLSVGATAADNPLKEYRANLMALSPRGQSKEIKQATGELQRKLINLFGKAVRITTAVESDGTIVFGTPASGSAVFKKMGGFDALGPNDYLITSKTLSNHSVTTITSNSEVGVLNGVRAFIKLLDAGNSITSLNKVGTPKPTAPDVEPGASGIAPIGITAPVKPAHGKQPPAGRPAATPPAVHSDDASNTILGIKLDLKWVSAISALSLLLSLSALILALIVSRQNRMSNSALRAHAGQSEDRQGVNDRLSRLENLVKDLLARHPELAPPVAERAAEAPRPHASPHDSGIYSGHGDYFDDEPVTGEPPPARTQTQVPVRKPVVPDRLVDQEVHNLISEYHKLIARRLSGLQDFVDRYGAQPIEPMSETGLFRTGTLDQDNYLWAVSIADRDDYIVILPGKEMIRKWSLFSKAAGSGARPYLNGAYNLTTGGRGELAVLEPAIAAFDTQKRLFVLRSTGSLSGAT